MRTTRGSAGTRQLKLATRRCSDWGNVAELIQASHLAESPADQLGPTVRTMFKQCFDQANNAQSEGP